MPLQPRFEIKTMVFNLHTGHKHRILNVKTSSMGFLYRLQGFSGSVHEKFLFDSKEEMEKFMKEEKMNEIS